MRAQEKRSTSKHPPNDFTKLLHRSVESTAGSGLSPMMACEPKWVFGGEDPNGLEPITTLRDLRTRSNARFTGSA
jgi:hypothetical protein